VNPVIIKAIARKEFYHLVRDFRSLYLAFVIPLLLILMFGYALRMDVDSVKTVVVDYDKTGTSRDLVRKLDASSYFQIIRYCNESPSAIRYLDQGIATMAVVIPPG